MVGLRPMLRTPILAFGLGAIAGGFEVVALGATSMLAFRATEAALLGVVGVGIGGALGVLLGVPAGLLVDLATRRWARPRRYAAGMALVGLFLGCFYLWPLGMDKVEQGLVPAGIAFGLTPIGVAGVVWFNAGYWLRREDIGERRRLGWWFVGPLSGLLLAALGGVGLADRDYGSAQALADDPVVVMVAVSGLRADQVSAVSREALAATPSMDKLGADGVVFENVVSPVPRPGPAHAALMTGRHPVRADLVSAEDRLLRGYETVAEVFRTEGYATAGFVSAPVMAAGRGFEQGFEVWDDDPGLPIRGVRELQLVQLALSLRSRLDPSGLVRRTDAQTVAQVGPWLSEVGTRPAFIWVQLEGPALAGDGVQMAEALRVVDADIDDLRVAVETAVGTRPLTFAVVGTHGQSLGEHPDGGGLYDESVRVPFLVAPHAMRGVKHRRIALQVRLMDIPATLLALCRLDPMEDSEGADLMGFAQGLRNRDYASLLALPRSTSEGGLLLGYRAALAGREGNIKFLLEHGTGRSRLFDLVEDPGEETNLASSQGDAVAMVRARVLREAASLVED